MKHISTTKKTGNQPQLANLLDFSPTIIYCAVPSGDFRITYISNNLYDILGYTPQEIYADNDFWHDHIHPEDRPMVFSNLPQLFILDKYIVDYRFHHKNGHYLWLHDQLRLIRDDNGEAIDVVGSLTDITGNKQTEILLEKREKRIKAVLDNAQDGIITTDSCGCIDSANPAAAKIFGYSENELVGENIRVLMTDSIAGQHDSYLQHYMQTHQSKIIGAGLLEVAARRKNGSEFPLEIAIDHIHHTDEDHFLSIFRDISKRKEIERELFQYSNRMTELVDQKTAELIIARDDALAAVNAMSSFLSNMSHELRTPLHGILSFASFGIKKYQRVSAEKLCLYFTDIHDSGTILLGLINNLLDLSKLRAGKMVYDYQLAHLDPLVQEVLHEMRILSNERRIRVDFSGGTKSNEIVMDKTKIAQVIRNLLSNAIKFSPDNSVINITTIPDTNGGLCLQISDQGLGIPQQECELIFDAFTQSSKTQTNAGGTGLGLPICREIIEQGHGGKISACNGIDIGAVFTVQFHPTPNGKPITAVPL